MSRLLQEFPAVSTETWEEAIRRDLKRTGPDKKLDWESPEALRIKPFYRSEDLNGLECLDTAPGDFPYLRGLRCTGDWQIREEIEEAEPQSANRAAVEAIKSGAEEIEFRSVSPQSASELEILLSNLEDVPVHFHGATEGLLRLLLKIGQTHGWSTDLSPLSHIELARELASLAPGKVLTVDAGKFEEAGGTTVQEIGFTLAEGIEFLASLEALGIEADRTAGLIAFSFGIGSNYFFQIAKLRAFRLVWARAVESFGGTGEGAKARIHARSSRWNKTIYDPHVNILRGTTEAMSAILGGADSITVASFDSCYKPSDAASRRLARNTQIILKQEAQLARVADPGAGSYYLEALTDSVARQSWKIMQEIEAAGGFQKAVGRITQALRESLAAREKAVAQRRRVFVGTNKYPNSEERALDRIMRQTNGVRRGAEVFEQIRLRTEQHARRTGKPPRILLAEMGDLKMRVARSNFAYNFFGCAGFEIIQQRFDNTEVLAESDADVIVLCSSDPEYLALVGSLVPSLKKRPREVPIIIAGNPDSAEQLKALGVADFVHVRSNPVEMLEKWQAKLGSRE
jgi:methylmalonyl-CoA mutase